MKNQFQDIPEDFYSFETKRPFEHCIDCNSYLLDGKTYMIEKAMKRYDGYSAEDTIFDYAICLDCATRMRKEFSRKSLENLDNYFARNFKMRTFDQETDLNIDECLGSCMVKEIPKEETQEFQLYAFCQGKKLVKNIPPYMISGQAIEEVLPLISQQTTDFLNGFYKEHFSPDPSLFEPVPGNKLIFI